jgi:hypothetical protein
MRRSGLALFAIALSVAPALAQQEAPLRLSWRVGTDIDSLQREYFGLFPGVASFRSATARAHGDGVMFSIDRGTRGDTALTISREAFDELGRFVDALESVLAGEKAVEMSRMPAVRTSQPYASGEELEVERRDGSLVRGRLAGVDDRGVTMWLGSGHYDPIRLHDDLVVIPVAEIDRINAGSHFWIGAAIGTATTGALAGYLHTLGHEPPISISNVAVTTAIGGLLGGVVASLGDVADIVGGNDLLYAPIPARLHGHEIFYKVAPPELRALADSSFEHAGAAPPLQSAGPTATLGHVGLNLSAGIGPAMSIAATTYPVTKSFNRTDEGELVTGAFAWRVEASYDLSSGLSVAGGVVVRNAFRSDTTVNAEWTSSIEPIGLLEINLTPHGPLRRRRVEVVTGIGGGFISLTHTGQLPSGTGSTRRIVESSHSTPLGLGRLTVVLNSSTRLAFYSGLEARIVPSVTIPYYAYRDDPKPEFRYKWVDEHDVNLSTIELQVGARFRF